MESAGTRPRRANPRPAWLWPPVGHAAAPGGDGRRRRFPAPSRGRLQPRRFCAGARRCDGKASAL